MTSELKIRPWLNDSGFSLLSEDLAVTVSFTRLGFAVDPEALRDWVESQRPKPRYTVKLRGALSTVCDDGEGLVASFYGPDSVAEAMEYAAKLNEREASEPSATEPNYGYVYSPTAQQIVDHMEAGGRVEYISGDGSWKQSCTPLASWRDYLDLDYQRSDYRLFPLGVDRG